MLPRVLTVFFTLLVMGNITGILVILLVQFLRERTLRKRTQQIDDLEKKLIQIQQSTRVLVPYLQNWHEKLRIRFRWYYNWHLKSYAKKVHFGILVGYLAIFALYFGTEYVLVITAFLSCIIIFDLIKKVFLPKPIAEDISIHQQVKNLDKNEIEEKLEKIQASTHTTFKKFIPWHEKLRIRFRWYYNWHLNPYANQIHIASLGMFMTAVIAGSIYGIWQHPSQKIKAYSCTSLASGSWQSTSTWSNCNSTIPQSGDTVTIGAGHSISMSNTVTVSSLSITGTLNTGDYSVTTGNLTINSGGTFNAESASVTISGNFTNNGTYSEVGNIITFNGTSSQSISGSSATAFSGLTISNTSASVSVNNNISVSSTLSISSSAKLAPTSGVVISGSGTLTGSGTAQVSGSAAFLTQYTITNKTLTNLIVEYAGSGQTISNTTYGHLTIADGVTASSSTNLVVNGFFTIGPSANATFTPAAANVISGTGTLTGYGTAQVTRTAATADFSSQYTITNKTLTNLTIEYAAASAQVVSNVNYGHLKISTTSSAVATLAGHTIVQGNLIISSGGSLSTSASNYDLTVGRNWDNSGTFTANSGTVYLNSSISSSTIKTNGSSFNNLVQKSGPLGYWKLDEGANTTASDSSGFSYSGSTVNSPTWTTSVVDTNYYGGNPYGMVFNGTSQYINIPAPSTSKLNITNNQMSQSAWVYPTANIANSTIATKQYSYYFQRHSDGKLAVYHYGSNPPGYHYSTGTVPLNQWSHVAYVYNGSNITFYINGVASGSVNKTGSVTTDPAYAVRIGTDSAAGRWWQGRLDDIRVFNKALTAADIYDLYSGNALTSGTYTLQDNLDVNGNLTIETGTLDVSASNYSINLAGNYTNTGTLNARSGTFTFDATATGKTVTSGSSNFASVVFNGTGGGWVLQDNLTATNFTLSASAANGFNENNKTITTNGNLAITASSYAIMATGTWILGANGTITNPNLNFLKSFQVNDGVTATRINTFTTRKVVLGANALITGNYNFNIYPNANDFIDMASTANINQGNVQILNATGGATFTQKALSVSSNFIIAYSNTTFNMTGNWTVGTFQMFGYNNTTPNVLDTGGWAFNVNGNLIMGAGSVQNQYQAKLICADSIITVTGNVYTSTATSLATYELGAATLNIGGNLDFRYSSVVTVGGGSVINMNSSTTGKTIYTGGQTLENLTFNHASGGWTFNDTANISGNLTITNSETAGNGVNTNNQTVYVNNVIINGGKLTLGNSTVEVNQAWTRTAGTVVPGTSTVSFIDYQLWGNTITSGGQPFNNVTFDNIDGFWELSGDTQINGDFTINGGYLFLPSTTLTVGGDFNNIGGFFDHNSGTVKLTGSANDHILKSGGSTFNNLIQNNNLSSYWKLDEGTGITTKDSTSNHSDANLYNTTWSTDVKDGGYYGGNSNSLSFSSASSSYVNTNVDYSWGINDSFSISFWMKPTSVTGNQGVMGKGQAGGYGTTNWEWTTRLTNTTFEFAYWNTSGIQEISLSSTVSLNTWNHFTITYDPVNKAKLYKDGTNVSNDTVVTNALQNRTTPMTLGHSYYNGGTNYYYNGLLDDVRLFDRSLTGSEITNVYSGNTTTEGKYTLQDNLNVYNNLTIADGTLDTTSRTVYVTGNFVNLANITSTSSTFVFNATASGKTIDTDGATFNNIIFNGSGGDWTLLDDLDVDGNLSLSAGTLITNNKNIYVAGNWTNSVGTTGFTPGTGTVTFDGAASSTSAISGSTNFHNFTSATNDKILSFAISQTQGISGTFSVNGTSGHNIVLQRQGTSGTWSINPSGTRSVSYVTVTNSTNSNATAINPTNSVDGGGNTNWFQAIVINASVSGGNGTISPSGAVNVSYGNNQSFTLTPNSGYYIGRIIVDGNGVTGALSSPYTFTNVIVGHTIVVVFTANNTKIWDGEGPSTNWADGLNWTGNSQPSSSDSVIFDGTSTKDSSIDTGFAGTIVNMTINSGYTGTITGSRSSLAMNNYTQNAGTFSVYSVAPTISGDFTINGGTYYPGGTTTFTAGDTGNTIKSNGQSLGTVVFNNAAGGWQFNDTAIMTGLTITNSETAGNGVNLNNQTIDINGNVAINGGKLTAGSAAITVNGSWTRTAGTFIANTSGITFDATSSGKTITSGGQSFNNLTFNGSGGAWTLQDNITATTVTHSTGTLNDNGVTVTVNGSISSTNWSLNSTGTWIQNSTSTVRTYTYINNFQVSNGVTSTADIGFAAKKITLGTSSVLTGAGTATIEPVANDFIDQGSGAAISIAMLNINIPSYGTTLSQKAFSASTYVNINGSYMSSLNMTGNWNVAGMSARGDYDSYDETSSFIFNTNGYNLTNTGELKLGYADDCYGGGPTFNAKVYFSSGTHSISGDIYADTDEWACGDYTNAFLDLGSSTINLGGNLDMSSYIFITNDGTSTINMTAGDTGNVISANSQSLNNLTLNSATGGWQFNDTVYITGNFTITNSETVGNGVNLNNQTVDIDGDLSLNGGKLTAGSSTIFIGGSWTKSGGTFVPDTSAITFDSSGAGKTITTAGQSFTNVRFNGSGSTWMLQDNLTASGNTILSNGNLAINGKTYTSTGNFTKNGGVLTMSTSTDLLDIDGTTTISGGTVSIAGGAIIRPSGNVTISNNGTFTPGYHFFNLDGNTNQTISISGTGNDVGVSSGSYFQLLKTAETNTVTLNSSLSGYHFIHNTGTFNLNGQTADFNGVYYGYGNAKLQMASGTLQVGSNGYNGGSFSPWYCQSGWAEDISGGTIQVYGGIHATYGTAHFASGSDFTPTGGTFQLMDAATASIYTLEATNFNFYNLTLGDSSNIKDIQIHSSSQTIDINGDLTIADLATLTSNSKSIEVAGSWLNNGTFSSGTGTVTLDSTSSSKSLTSGGSSFYNITFNGLAGGWTLGDALAATNDFTLTNGTVTTSNNNITTTRDFIIANSGTVMFNAGSSTIQAGRHFTDAGSRFAAGTSAVNMTGTGTLTKGGSLYTISIAYTSQTTTIASNAFTVTNQFIVNGGTASSSGGYHVMNRTTSGSPFVFNAPTTLTGARTFYFNPSTSGLTITVAGGNYGDWSPFLYTTGTGNNATFNLGGAITTTSSINFESTTGITGAVLNTQNYALTAHSLNMGPENRIGTWDVNFGSSIVSLTSTGNCIGVSSYGGTYVYNLGSASITCTGNISLYNSTGGGSITLTPGTSTVNMTAGDTGNTILSNGQSFNNLTFNNSAGGWIFSDAASLTGNLTITDSEIAGNGVNFNNQSINIDGNITINGGKLTAGSSTIAAGGNWTRTAGTFVANTSTVTFDATSTAVGKTITSGSQSFNNATFNKTGGTWAIQDAMSVNGNLTITAGTLNGNGQGITVAGNWSNSATYTAAAGAVTFGGATSSTSIISGSTTFSVFNCSTNDKVLSFTAGTTQTITSSFNVNGTSGHNIILQREGGSGVWSINPSGSRSVSYVTVSNSTNTAAAVINPSNSVDGGGNTNWFQVIVITASAGANGSISPSGSVNVGYGSNQSFTITPNSGYYITTVIVDGSPLLNTYGNPYVYTFNNVTVSHTISASFTANNTKIWDGEGPSTNWADGLNWTGNTAPASTDSVTFNSTSTKSSSVDTGFGGTITNLNINTGYTGTITASRSLSMTNYNQAVGTFNSNGHALTVNGGWNITGGTYTAGTSTITFSGSGPVDIRTGGQAFYNLVFNYSNGEWVFQDSVTMNNLTVTDTYTGGNGVNFNNQTIDINGNVSIGGGKLTAGSATITVAGNWSRTGGTFTANTSSITFDATSSGKTIISGGQSFNNLTFNGSGGAWTLQDNTATSNLTLTNGTVNAGATTITVSGNWDSSATGGSFSAGTSTINLTGTGNVSVENGVAFYNLTCAYNTKTTTATSALWIDNVLTVYSGGTFTGSQLVYLQRSNGDPISNTGATLNQSFQYYPAGSITIAGHNFGSSGVSYRSRANGVVINLTSNVTASAISVYGPSPITSYVTLNTGTSNITTGNFSMGNDTRGGAHIDLGSGTHTFSGNFTTGGTTTDNSLNLGSSTINVGGNINFTGIPVTPGTSNINMNAGDTDNTIISASQSFNNLTFNNAAGRWQFNDAASILGNLTITNSETAGNGVNFNNQAINIDGNFQMDGGKLTMGSSAVTAAGNWTINGGTQTPNTSTVTFDASTTGKTIKSSSQTFNNIVFSNAAGAWTFTDNSSTASNFTITNGTVNAGATTISVAGNWNASAGTFDKGTSVVQLTGTGSISNSYANRFYDLVAAYPTKTTSGSVNIDRKLTINGGTLSAGVSIGWGNDANPFTIVAGSTISSNIFVTSNTATTLTVNIPAYTYQSLTFKNNNTTGTLTYLAQGNITATSIYTYSGQGGTCVFDSGGHTMNFSGTVYAGESGDTLRYGQFAFGTSTVTVGGDIIIRPSNVGNKNKISLTSGTLNVGGSWTNSDTFTAGSGTVVFNSTSAGKTITSNGSAFNNITFNGVGGAWTLQDNTTTTGNFTVTNGAPNIQDYQLSVGGNYDINGGEFSQNDTGINFVILTGSGKTIRSSLSTYNARRLKITGSYTSNGNVAFGKTYSDGYGKLIVDGGILTMNSTLYGYLNDTDSINVINSGDIQGTGIWHLYINKDVIIPSFTATASGSIALWGSYSYTLGGNISLTNKTLTSYGSTALNTGTYNLSIGNIALGDIYGGTGTLALDLGSGTHVVSGNLTRATTGTTGNALNFGSSNVSVGGNIDFTGITVTAGTSTITMNAGDTDNTIVSASQSLNNLTFDNLAGRWQFNDTATIAGNFTVTNTEGTTGINLNNQTVNVAGNFSINGGKVTAGSAALNIVGNWSSASGSFDHGTSTVTLSGSSKTLSTPASTWQTGIFDKLTISGSVTITTSTWLIGNDATNGLLTIADNGTFTVNSGVTSYFCHNRGITINTGATLGGAGTLQYYNSGTIDLGTKIVNNGTINISNINFYLSANSTATIPAYNYGGNVSFYNNGTANTTARFGSGTVTIGGNLTVLNNAIGYTTTLSAATYNNQINVGGNWNTGTRATFAPGSSTVNFTATSAKTITSGNQPFFNIAFNGVGGSWAIQDNLDINGNLNIVNGTLNGNSMGITVAGNWSNIGTYTAGTGAVTFDGNTGSTSIISGNNSFSSFFSSTDDKILSFAAGSTQNITAMFSINGTSGHNIVLQREGATGVWSINPSGSRSVSYVTVSNSTNTNATAINPTYSVDNGGNTNWFATITINASVSGGNGTISPSGAVNVSYGNSQSFTLTPNSGYYIGRIIIDDTGITGTLSSPYTFYNVTTSHTIVVTFIANNTKVWDGEGSTNNWSDGPNWTGNSNPTSSETAIFNATSSKNSTIDATFAGTVLNLNINTGYTGTISASRSLAMTDFTQSTGSTATFNSNGQALTVSGSWNAAGGTLTPGATTITFNASSAKTINDYNNQYMGNLVFDGTGSWNFTSPATIGNLTVSNSSATGVNLNGQSTTIAGDVAISAGKLIADNTTVYVGGIWNITGTGNYQVNGSTNNTFNATSGTKNITTRGQAFNNIIFNGTGGTWSLIDNLSAANLTLTNGTVNANATTITISGNWDASAAGATFNAGTSSVNLTGTGNLATKSLSNGFYNLSCAYATKTTTVTFASFGAARIDGVLTVNGGTLSNSNGAIALAGTQATRLVSTNASSNINVSYIDYWANGASNNNLTINVGANATFNTRVFLSSSASGVTYTLNQNLTAQELRFESSNAGNSFNTSASNYSLTLTGTNGMTSGGYTLVPHTNTFTVNLNNSTVNTTNFGPSSTGYNTNVTDTVNFNGSTINISNDYKATYTSGSYTANWTINPGTSTVNMTAGDTNNTITSNSQTFNNLTFNNAAGRWTLNDAVSISGNLTLTTTEGLIGVDTGGWPVNVDGNVVIDGGKLTANDSIINVGGSWTKNAGNFTAGASEVIFDSTTTGKTITSGAESFNILTFNGTGAEWTLQDNLTTNQINVTLGRLIDNAKTLTINGNITIANVTGLMTSTGYWIQGASGNISNPYNGNHICNLSIAGTGVTTTLTNNVFTGRNNANCGLTIGSGTLFGASRTLYQYSYISSDNFDIQNPTIGSALSSLTMFNYANRTLGAMTFPNGFGSVNMVNMSTANTNMTASGDWNFGNSNVTFYSYSVNGTTQPVIYTDMATFSLQTTGNVNLGSGTTNAYLKLGTSTNHSIGGNLISNGTGTGKLLELGSSSLSVGGNINFTGVSVNAGTSTINMASIVTGKTITSSAQSFNNLTFDGTGGAWTFQDATQINGNLTITNGTVTFPSTTLTVNGNFANNGGTFNHNSGTAILTSYSSAATLKTNGSSFNNLNLNQIDENLVGYWKLDEGSGTTAIDYSNTRNNGTLVGPTTLPTWSADTYNSGYYGGDTNSVNLDGSDDYVNVPDNNAYDGNTMTISMWLKLNDNGQWMAAYRPASGSNQWYVYQDNDTSSTFSYYIGGARYNLYGGAATAGQWHNHTFVIAPGSQKTYRDGVLINSYTNAAGLAATDGNIKLGEYGSAGVYSVNGLLDEVKIYNRVLTDNEISALYTGTNPSGGTFALQDDLTITNNLNINSGMLDVNAANYNVKVAGNFINNSRFYSREGTLTMNGTGTGNIKTNGSELNNLNINNESLLSYWNFNEGSGTTAQDISGNNSNANLTGNPTWSSNVVNNSYFNSNPKSLQFNGTSQYITTPTISNARSISMWLNTSQASGTWHYLLDARTGLANGYFTSNGVGSGWNKLYVNGVNSTVSWSSIPLNQWVHIYLEANTNFTDDITFMARYNGVEHLAGYLDDVRIYNRPLTTSEISSLSTGFHPTEGTYTLQDNLNLKNDLGVRTGELDVSTNNYDINVTGSFYNASNFNPRSGIITLNGASTENILSGGVQLNNIEINNGLAGYWNLNEGGGTTANDLSGNGINGTFVGSPVWTSTTKDSSYYSGNTNAIDIPGSGSYINLGNDSRLKPDNITIGAWVKADTLTTWNGIMSNMASWGTGFSLQMGTGQKIAAMISGAYLTTSWTPTTDTWYHIMATHDSTTNLNRLYVNGTLENSMTRAVTYADNAVTHIGDFYTTGGLPFDGIIDDVRIYNRALTETEIFTIYSGTNPTEGTYSLQDAMNINGSLSIYTGKLDVTAYNYDVNVAGNFTNAANFDGRNGTVTLDGGDSTTQKVLGNSNFYNVSATTTSNSAGRTVQYGGGSKQIISGTYTMTGATGKILTMGSTDTNNWTISPTNYVVDYTTVSRSTSTTALPLCAQHSTDGLNNVNWRFSAGTGCNSAPSSPSSLSQTKTDDSAIATGGWINSTGVKFKANISDTDNPETLYLCVEKKPVSQAFSNTEDSCSNAVTYTGTPVSATVSMTVADATAYHWQARVKDQYNQYSSWVAYGGNADPGDRDFGIDTTAPTSGVVNDGTGADAEFNNGSLTSLSANWSFNAATSGIQKYEYAIKRGYDNYYWNSSTGWQSGETWYNNGSSTTVTVNSMNLQTNVSYITYVKATDNAGNVSTTVYSNGQQVLQTLAFSIGNTTITFNNLNNTNDWTDTQINTVTTSTNASGGYSVRGYITGPLTSTPYASRTIPNFTGTWLNPTEWLSGTYGFGYTSYDTTIQGTNKFNTGNYYAAFTENSPGDIVADHTEIVNGTTGAINNEQFTMRYKLAVPVTQVASSYTTNIIYIVTANF